MTDPIEDDDSDDDNVVAFTPGAGINKVSGKPEIYDSLGKRKPQPDWEKLEIYYRSGYSLRKLATLPESDGCSFKTIHKRAKSRGWQVDLSKEIQQRARQQLYAGDAPLPEDPDELKEAIVSRAVQQHVDIAKALKEKTNRASRFIDHLGDKIDEAIATGIIDPLISGGRLSLGDIIKQYITATQTMQGGGGARYTHDLDSTKNEPKPFVPQFGKRGAPGFDESDDDE